MFHSARLKLTAWYLLIIMLISVSFSAIIYKMLTAEVERFDKLQRFRIERRLEEQNGVLHIYPQIIPMTNPELVEETKKRIFGMLTGINVWILVLSGGLGYLLAGRTLKPIKEMMDEQSRFISDASHELRTPLTSLKSAFEVYLRDHHPTLKESKTLIRESIGDVNKLQFLSESLLQLAQYQQPTAQNRFEIVSLDQCLKESIHKIDPIAKKKKVSVTYETTAIDMEANKYGLIDLFVILLDNAIKYSAPKEKIEVVAKKAESCAVITVTDHGIGISEKDLPFIFDRFYRADIARSKSEEGGYGLGLSIAKKIVTSHKGTISVASKSGKGSTFTVRIPLKQPRI